MSKHTHTTQHREGTAGEAMKAPSPLPSPGTRVSYRCRGFGQLNDAQVLSARTDGSIDIEVMMNPPLRLTRVPWWSDDPRSSPRGSACAAQEGKP